MELPYNLNCIISWTICSLMTIFTVLAKGQKSVQFLQPGSYLEVAHHSSLSSEKMTLEFWLSLDDVGEPQHQGEQTVFDKRMNGKGYNVRLAGTEFPLPVFTFYEPANEIHYFPGVFRKRWNHFAYLFDKDSTKILVNGQVVGSRASGSYDHRSTAPLRIGEFLGFPGAALWLRGELDEIRIWNTIRSIEQVQEFMHKALTGNENNLQLYLDFESSTANQINDQSKNNNHAKMIGQPVLKNSSAPIGYVPLPVPSGFRSYGTDQGITLEWEAMPQAGGYKLYRSTSSQVELTPANQISSIGAAATSFMDRSVTAGRLYYYVIVAQDGQNHDGQPSNVSVSRTSPKADFITGVYYYPWYIPEQDHHPWPGEYVRDYFLPKQPPVLGEYSSAATSTIRQHLQWMSSSGIDYLVSSWWGPESLEDVVLKSKILPEISSTAVKFSVYYESAILGLEQGKIEMTSLAKQSFIQHFEYLANIYFKQPNYLTMEGKPVVFIYLAHIYSGAYAQAYQEMRSLLKAKGIELFLIGDVNIYDPVDEAHTAVLDGLSPYIPLQSLPQGKYPNDIDFLNTLAMAHNRLQTELKQKNKLYVPNVFPGFNNLGVKGEILFPRQLSAQATLSSLYENMIKVTRPFIDTDKKMVMITSWNEWHEDSQIEPTVITANTNKDNSSSGNSYTRGFSYGGYGPTFLDLTNMLLGPASTVAVKPTIEPVRLRMYPNPIRASLYLSAAKEMHRVSVQITTLTGTIIHHQYYNRLSAGVPERLDTSFWPEGLFILILSSDEGWHAEKIIIKR